VGEAVKAARSTNSTNVDDILIVTKVHPRSFSLEAMSAAILESRSNLLFPNLPHAFHAHSELSNDINPAVVAAEPSLDVVLLHSPRCWSGHCTPEEEAVMWPTAWRNLETLKRAGHIKFIGVSNFDERELTELLQMADSRVAVIQVPNNRGPLGT
jgi:diketogulonate reductase-like aldo/keto reductase